MTAFWVQLGVDSLIVACLVVIISILRDIAQMERFNYHGAEKRN